MFVFGLVSEAWQSTLFWVLFQKPGSQFCFWSCFRSLAVNSVFGLVSEAWQSTLFLVLFQELRSQLCFIVVVVVVFLSSFLFHRWQRRLRLVAKPCSKAAKRSWRPYRTYVLRVRLSGSSFTNEPSAGSVYCSFRNKQIR